MKNPRYEGAFIAANAYIANNGGEGSGNFDHEGRPGKVGGSSQDNKAESYYNEKTKTIELKGDELGSSDEEIRENGLKYFKEKYQGKKFDNPELNGILFSNPGIKKFMTNSADINKVKAIPALKDIIEKGEYQGEEEPKHKREDRIVKFHRINHNVSISGKKENMSVLVGEDRDGNRFYNLNNRSYTAKNSSRGERAIGVADEEFSINIIASNSDDFNPMDFINNLDKGGQMDEKLKELCTGLVNAFMKAKNEADEEKEKADSEKEKEKEAKEKEEEAKNKAKNEEKDGKGKEEAASNEDVDKRKLIDEIGGILKGKVDEELWRTIIGKAEKIAYEKSSTGTADNKAKNKAKNEDKEKEDEYDKLKEEIFEEVKNQIAKNSMDSLKSAFFQGEGDIQSSYQTREDRLEAGMKY